MGGRKEDRERPRKERIRWGGEMDAVERGVQMMKQELGTCNVLIPHAGPHLRLLASVSKQEVAFQDHPRSSGEDVTQEDSNYS